MKVGDMVRVRPWAIRSMSADTPELIVKIEEYYLMAKKSRWATLHNGKKFELRELELINEGIELSDEQLENVRGGMDAGYYATWRSRLLNEGG